VTTSKSRVVAFTHTTPAEGKFAPSALHLRATRILFNLNSTARTIPPVCSDGLQARLSFMVDTSLNTFPIMPLLLTIFANHHVAVTIAELLTLLNLHLLGALDIGTPDQVVRIINFTSDSKSIEHVKEFAIGNLFYLDIVKGTAIATRT